MSPSGGGAALAGPLWLDALQRLAARAAHEIKGPLNGLALNLEVVRSRAERAGTEAAAIAPFAAAAADALGRAVELTDSLITLARPARMPVDLWETLRPLVRLYDAVAAAGAGEVVVVPPAVPLPAVRTTGDATRAALAVALEAVVQDTSRVRGTLDVRDATVWVTLEGTEPPVAVSESACALLAAAGVEVRCSSHDVTLVFAASGGEGMDTT